MNLISSLAFSRHTQSRLKPRLAVGFLALLLMFIQGVEQNHSHFSDLESSVDCELCAKLGTGVDVIPVSVFSFDVHPLEFLVPAESPRISLQITWQPNSRAPPLA